MQRPDWHDHAGSPAPRRGQSAALLQRSVQPPTTMVMDSSHAEGAMHAVASWEEQGASALTHTRVEGFPTPMHP